MCFERTERAYNIWLDEKKKLSDEDFRNLNIVACGFTEESSRGTTLTADTIFYDRRLGRGEAFGNMIMTDTINKMIMEGDYGYFDSMIDSAFVSGRARVIQYRPVGDGDFDPDKVRRCRSRRLSGRRRRFQLHESPLDP